MERRAEWRRREGHAEGHIGIERVDRRLGRVLPVDVGKIRRRQLRVPRHAGVRAARVDRILLQVSWGARRRALEAGDGDAAHRDIRSAAVGRKQRQLHPLSANHESIVCDGVEREAVRRENGIRVVALLDAEPEVDLVASGVAERHRCEAGAQRSDCGETRFDRSGGRRVVAFVEGALRALGLVDDGGHCRPQRIRWVGAGELHDAREAGVDGVEEPGFVLLHLTGNRRVDELIRRRATPESAAAAKSWQRRQTAGTLALVITVRVGADLRVCAAKELVVRCGAHARDFQSWRLRFGRDRWRCLP